MIELVTLCYICKLRGRETEATCRMTGGPACPQCQKEQYIANMRYEISQERAYGNNPILIANYERLIVQYERELKELGPRVAID